MPLETILLVNDFGHINGGAAQVAVTSALGLAERGYQVYYFCAVPPIDPQLRAQPNVRVVATHQDDILHNPNRMEAFAQGLWNRKSAAALSALLETLPAARTVVHVHGWTKALSASIFPAVQRAGHPTVVTLHDYFIACPNGGFFNYPRQEICHLTPLSPQCILTHCDVRSYPQKLWRVGRGYVQKYAAHLPSGVGDFIVPSAFTGEILDPYLPTEARVHRVLNPIDTPHGQRVCAEKNHTYVVVGRVSPEKGVDLAARAAARLGLRLEIIGDGEQIDAVRKLYPATVFTGWLDRAALFDHLQHARALIFPSRLYETYGLVVSEAAAMGIPAVVSDQTAARELVDDGHNGFLFRSGDVDSLAEKLSLAEDDALLKQLSEGAYQRYWANPPTPDRYIDRLIDVYERVLHHQTNR